MLCGHKFCGSLTQVVNHLLGVSNGSGDGGEGCKAISDEQKVAVHQDYDISKAEKGKREVKRQRIQREIDVSSSPEIASHTSKFGGSSSTPTALGGSGTTTLNTFWKPVDKQKVDDSLAEMFYACSIPFNVAMSPYFKNAIKKVVDFLARDMFLLDPKPYGPLS